MKRLFRAAVLSLAFGGLVLAAPQAVEAKKSACVKISAMAAGHHKAAAHRAKVRVKRRAKRWAWRKHAKVVYIGKIHVSCKKGKYGFARCKAWAKACK